MDEIIKVELYSRDGIHYREEKGGFNSGFVYRRDKSGCLYPTLAHPRIKKWYEYLMFWK